MREASLEIVKELENQKFMQDCMMFLASHDAIEHAKQVLSEYLEVEPENGVPEP